MCEIECGTFDCTKVSSQWISLEKIDNGCDIIASCKGSGYFFNDSEGKSHLAA